MGRWVGGGVSVYAGMWPKESRQTGRRGPARLIHPASCAEWRPPRRLAGVTGGRGGLHTWRLVGVLDARLSNRGAGGLTRRCVTHYSSPHNKFMPTCVCRSYDCIYFTGSVLFFSLEPLTLFH